MTVLTQEIAHDFSTGVTRMWFGGELDMKTSSELKSGVLKALAEHPLAVVIDINRVCVLEGLALLVFPSLMRLKDPAPLLVCARPDTDSGQLIREGLYPRIRIFDDEATALHSFAAQGVPSRRLHAHLPCDDHAPAMARGLVAAACDEWALPQLRLSAEVIASELVTNAVRHAHSDVEITVALGRQHLHLHVRDRDTGLPTPFKGAGRGMKVVDRFATAWGTIRAPKDKTVWAKVKV